MNTSAEALLQLSNIVINGRGQTIPDNADWQDVLALAKKQGIRGLVYDAFDNLKKSGADIKGFPESEQILKIYTQTVLTENLHTRYFELAKHVSEMWKRHGIEREWPFQRQAVPLPLLSDVQVCIMSCPRCSIATHLQVCGSSSSAVSSWLLMSMSP